MSTSESIPFVPDASGRAIQFQKSGSGSIYTQVVIAKGGGDLNVGSAPAITASALSAATAEVVLAENHKRVRAWIYNSHATEAVRLIGAVGQAGGKTLAAVTGEWFEGGGALYAFANDGSGAAITFHVLENKIGA